MILSFLMDYEVFLYSFLFASRTVVLFLVKIICLKGVQSHVFEFCFGRMATGVSFVKPRDFGPRARFELWYFFYG